MPTLREQIERAQQLGDRMRILRWLQGQMQPYLNEESFLTIEDTRVGYASWVYVHSLLEDLAGAVKLELEQMLNREGEETLTKEDLDA